MKGKRGRVLGIRGLCPFLKGTSMEETYDVSSCKDLVIKELFTITLESAILILIVLLMVW